MTKDPFGNLREWGSVLELLADLSCRGCLGECQQGLIRILRFRGNWRLREEVLKRLELIQTPSEELIEQVSEIILDDSIYYEARILASKVLASLINNRQRHAGAAFRPSTQSVIKNLQSLTKMPHPPIFHVALSRCLHAIA